MHTEMSLPTGWRRCVAPDGRLYYQNDITQQTQWHPPIQQQQIAAFNTSTTSDKENKLIQRRIWDKEHLIWLFFFGIMFYDLATDIQVAIAWLSLESLCPQFQCHTLRDGFLPMEYAAIIMFICSIIGFIADLILKAHEAKSLYNVYRTPMTEKELNKTNLLSNYKRTMKYGWIPSMIEDLMSILLIILALAQGVLFYVGLRGKYIQSLLTSCFFSTAGTLWGWFKWHRKYRNVVLNPAQEFEIKQARGCHKCWCCCLMIMISVMGYITAAYILVAQYSNMPLIELQPDDGKSNSILRNNCDVFTYSGATNESYDGRITQPPNQIYPGCYGDDYNYNLLCVPDRSKQFANCTLKWYYDGENNNTISINCDETSMNKCEFDIQVGFCGNYTIDCTNDFTFQQGNPKMWACIDFCA